MGSQEMVSSHDEQGGHHQVLLLPAASAKPRLKWTRLLHEQFVDAVSQLGGADKATPKSVMRKHLQLRIEAQGKYLQTVLKKAQETLAGYGLDITGFDAAKAEISALASGVETECLSSSSSQDNFFIRKRAPHGDFSTESCLTTSDAPEPKDAVSLKQECSSSALNLNEDCDGSNRDGRKRMQIADANGRCASKRNCCIENDRAEHLNEDDSAGYEPQEIDLNR